MATRPVHEGCRETQKKSSSRVKYKKETVFNWEEMDAPSFYPRQFKMAWKEKLGTSIYY